MLERTVGQGVVCRLKVSLSPGHIVLDGNPAHPQKGAPSPKGGAQPPIFGPCLLWPNCWMNQNATCYGGRPWPRRHCVRWRPSSPFRGGPQFWGREYIPATVWPIATKFGTVTVIDPLEPSAPYYFRILDYWKLLLNCRLTMMRVPPNGCLIQKWR